MGPLGLEPRTYGLKVRSSAIELEALAETISYRPAAPLWQQAAASMVRHGRHEDCSTWALVAASTATLRGTCRSRSASGAHGRRRRSRRVPTSAAPVPPRWRFRADGPRHSDCHSPGGGWESDRFSRRRTRDPVAATCFRPDSTAGPVAVEPAAGGVGSAPPLVDGAAAVAEHRRRAFSIRVTRSPRWGRARSR